MPLVRPTLATAVSTVQGLIVDMRKAARETGSAAGLDHLLSSLDALDAYCTSKKLECEVALQAPLSGEDMQKAAAAIVDGFPVDKLQRGQSEPTTVEAGGGPVDLRVHLRPLSLRTVQRAGATRPPILVLVIPRAVNWSEDDLSAIERSCDDRPQVILVGQPDEPYFKDVESRAKSVAWATLKVDVAKPPEEINSVASRFASPPFDSFPDLYRAHSACVALDSLTGVLNMVADQVGKELRLNKQVTQQKLAKFGGSGPGAAKPPSPAAEIIAEIKGRTQRLASEFERGAQERLFELLNQPTGSLARELESMILNLDHLEQEQKVTTISSRVPPEFEAQINRTIRERFFRHAAADLVAMNDLFRMIGQDVDRTLAAAGGYPLSAEFRYLTDDRVKRVLDMYATFQVMYKGESPSKGFQEYLGAIRKYSMLLVMGASMFGMSSLVRTYREITVPVTIILVGWGAYAVYTGAKRQHIEILEKQLDDAKKEMRQEIKRILSELQKGWGMLITQYMKEQIDGGLAELETGIKDFQARRGGVGDPEKDRLSRQAQALDAAEKKLTASVKTRETVIQAVSSVRGDLKGLTTGGPPKPGMPGAAKPGMPGMPAMPGMAPKMPAMPAKPAGPSMADAKAAAMADAKAKLEAGKAPKADAGQGAASSDAPKAPSPMEALKAKMAASKAGAGAAAKPAEAVAPAAAPAAASPAAPAPAADASAASAAEAPAGEAAPAAAPAAAASADAAKAPEAAKVNPMDAYKAKMAAMKAGGAAKPAAGDAAKAEEAPAAGNGPTPAPAAAAAKPNPMDAYKAKMAAMKAGGAAAAPAVAAAAPAAAAAAPASAPKEPEPEPGEVRGDETHAIPAEAIEQAKASE